MIYSYLLTLICFCSTLYSVPELSRGRFYDDERGITYTVDKKYLHMYKPQYDLDFSIEFPELETLSFPNEYYDYSRKIKSDLGLSRNTNVKQLIFNNFFGIALLNKAELPHVETLNMKVNLPPYHLKFLETSVPYLKNLRITFPSQEERFLTTSLHNISKLPYLEKLELNTYYGLLDFTENDLKEIFELQHLKTLTIKLGCLPYLIPQCDALELKLQSILPNTEVTFIKRICEEDHD